MRIVSSTSAVLLLLFTAGLNPSLSAATVSPDQVTGWAMYQLGSRIANGDSGALPELQEIAKTLYRDLDLRKDEVRVLANFRLMKVAFDVLGEQAGRGNDRAFQALKTSLRDGLIGAFAPDALGIAAAAGHAEALEMLLHYKNNGILLSSAIFALQPVAAKYDYRTVDFLIAVLENPDARALWYGASEGLKVAVPGSEKAQAALEKYKAAHRK